LLMGTISVTGIDSAFANKSDQKIEQDTEIEQDSFCVSASTVPPTASCNNMALGFNVNTGNIAGGQD
ncbi:MAG: hypothetical protein H0X50_12295, partial [Nitrosopumilus sp.]|nr:hypothetical protein [Nitrosopumilus sp.]